MALFVVVNSIECVFVPVLVIVVVSSEGPITPPFWYVPSYVFVTSVRVVEAKNQNDGNEYHVTNKFNIATA